MRRALLFVVFALVSISAKALWFEQDGIYYETRTDGVWVMPNKYKGDIVIPSTVTYKGIEYTVVGIGSAFTNRPEVTSVTIPNTVTTLGEFSFQACGLTSIIIPNSVTVIGSAAFQECNNLESVTIGNGVDSIGTAAFRNCTSLKSISIPDNVTKLGNAAFADCNNLTTITIGNGIKTIGESAFRECTSLSSVVMQNSDNSETSIGECAFWHCKSLASINLSNSLTSIGEKAFEGCTSLASINLPNSLTSIESWAFKDCTSLTSIDIPNKVTSISCHLVGGCTNLKTMSVDRNIETFYGCSIAGCKNLTSLVCKNPNPPKLGRLSDFDYNVLNTILYVPKGSEEAYKKAEGWKHFGTIKAIGEDGDTDNTNTDDKTTDDNNTDDNKTDDGISDGDSGWSINIKIKGEDIAQCSIDNIESIEFTEDGLYIIINYKDGKSAKYDMSKFESIDFSEKGGNNEDVDDVETSEESSQGQMSLMVDDKSFYAVNCTAEQTRSGGMYLHIRTAEDPEFPYFGRELIVHISPSKVAELKEGDVFGANKLNVESFKSADLIIINGTKWNELEGNITIKKITDMEMTIVINDLQIENDSSKVKHTIRGTAVLTSGVYDSKGNLLSFKNAIE